MTDLSQEIETLKRELEEKKKEIRSLEELLAGAPAPRPDA